MKQNTYSKYQIKHIEFVKNKLAKAVTDYKMIKSGDRVLVAVSGGKDSLVLLDALAGFKKFGLVDFELEALHINVSDVPYQVDNEYLTELCRSLDVKMNFAETTAGIEER